MPTNRPTMKELIEAVREFLEARVMPAVDQNIAFHTRVAVNTLGIVERELEKGPDLDQAEHERLRRLLKQDGGLKDLNAALCRQIREGLIDCRNPELMEHLRLTTLGRLSIDNPRYATYQRALGCAAAEPDA
jgi:hypothetical protein